MGFGKLEDIIALQLATQFKLAVYDLIERSERAKRDYKFVAQLTDALGSMEGNIAEGFHRNNPKEFVQFLRYSRGSHAEAETRVRDGVHRRYFNAQDCEGALHLARRSGMAILRLRQSIERFIEECRQSPQPSRPRRTRRT